MHKAEVSRITHKVFFFFPDNDQVIVHYPAYNTDTYQIIKYMSWSSNDFKHKQNTSIKAQCVSKTKGLWLWMDI